MEIILRQNEEGGIEIEQPGADGQPQITQAESIEDAIEQVKGLMGATEATEAPEATEEAPAPVDGEEVPMEEELPEEESPSTGKRMEDMMPKVDKEKMGMRPKKKASFADYGV